MPYRPTEKTEARKAETRERIIAAALAQVAEGGYASASVQRVSKRAGVAVGTVYRHFPSKAELFAEVFRHAAQHELDVVIATVGERARDHTAAERIALAVETFCRRALAGPVLAYAQIAEPVDPAVEAERLVLRVGYRDAFARVLEDGARSGELRPHDSKTVAAAMIGALGEALVGPLSPAARGEARSRDEALIATLVQFSLDALPTKERTHVGRRPVAA
jgi:AcrR family transcriptional regulator